MYVRFLISFLMCVFVMKTNGAENIIIDTLTKTLSMPLTVADLPKSTDDPLSLQSPLPNIPAGSSGSDVMYKFAQRLSALAYQFLKSVVLQRQKTATTKPPSQQPPQLQPQQQPQQLNNFPASSNALNAGGIVAQQNPNQNQNFNNLPGLNMFQPNLNGNPFIQPVNTGGNSIPNSPMQAINTANSNINNFNQNEVKQDPQTGSVLNSASNLDEFVDKTLEQVSNKYGTDKFYNNVRKRVAYL
jgi:hypothetical protein